MTKEEILAVQQSWSVLMNHMDDIGEQFYENLFEEVPMFEALFAEEKSRQGSKLMSLIGMAVTKLHLEKPDQTVLTVGKRHVAYGVKPEYFPKFGEVLIKTFKTALKSEWTPELETAWKKAYALLADLMIQAGEEQSN